MMPAGRVRVLTAPRRRNDFLIIVVSIALVLGMAVAMGLIAAWRTDPATMTEGAGYYAALVLCPPFLLVGAVSGVADSTLALVLATGSIVFGNGALYAGLAAFGYWAVSTFWPRKQLL
jgi:hypothetical protein